MRRRLNNAWREVQILRARLASRVLRDTIRNPVFLIGCSRAGKSSLGGAMALHPEVSFLDESRPLWIACFPQTDIWTKSAGARGGRLHLDRQDANERDARRLSALFRRETRGRPVLVQALAVNSFRLDFLAAAFPDAKFIHVIRNGLNVARDIAQRADKQGWHGGGGHKWGQLVDYAARAPHTAALPALCENSFERGLLEWRLSMEAIDSVAPSLTSTPLLEISYEELIRQPLECLGRVADFIGLAADSTWQTRAPATIHRPPESRPVTPREKDLLIGGPALQKRPT
jgi:hypothetical protein